MCLLNSLCVKSKLSEYGVAAAFRGTLTGLQVAGIASAAWWQLLGCAQALGKAHPDSPHLKPYLRMRSSCGEVRLTALSQLYDTET